MEHVLSFLITLIFLFDRSQMKLAYFLHFFFAPFWLVFFFSFFLSASGKPELPEEQVLRGFFEGELGFVGAGGWGESIKEKDRSEGGV